MQITIHQQNRLHHGLKLIYQQIKVLNKIKRHYTTLQITNKVTVNVKEDVETFFRRQ